MTQQAFIGTVEMPTSPQELPEYVNTLLDAANEIAGFVIQAPKDGPIAKVGFLTGVVTTGATVDVRLETLSGGDPSGTLLGTNSNGAQVIGALDDDTWFTVSLTTSVTVTKGQEFAVVIVNPSGSPGNLNIKHLRPGNSGAYSHFPYVDDFVGGAWVRDNESPCCTLEYSDGSYEYVQGVYPASAVTFTIGFSNTSTPDHRGLKFQLPVPVRITGMWWIGDIDGNADIKLYDSDGTTVLETLSMTSDWRSANGHGTHYILFDGTQDLAKDVYYRLVIEPTSATLIDLDEFDVATVAIMDSFEGGQLFHYTEKKDAGWTDTTTKRPWMGLLVDGFDDGAGGGGGGPGPKIVTPVGGGLHYA